MFIFTTRNSPHIITECVPGFEKENRMVVLRLLLDDGTAIVLHMPEYLMANVTGYFLKHRLFGLH